MKKFVIMLAVSAAAVSVFAMAKAPSEGCCPDADKACAVKEACSVKDAACKDAAKAACGAKDAAKEAGCTGGTCPLPKP